MTVNLAGTAQGESSGTARLDIRYSFTALFLKGAALLAQKAAAIEQMAGVDISEDLRSEHCAYVVGAIMQATTAMEAEIFEVVLHGPGHHLGSNGVHGAAKRFPAPLAKTIDSQSALARYDAVLHLLGKPPFDHGAVPYQCVDLLVKLRNAIVHYKSEWRTEMENMALVKRLRALRIPLPAFVSPTRTFFPQQCLIADVAGWAVTSSVAFIDDFYLRLGKPCPIDPHKAKVLAAS